ncbi:MAG: molybdopterin molybdotransferase MoeA, partial [Alphaproteobacteria bacterium]|nr:molybdopterin molybdotransferase MoeA [Alphaproteobacteria bacterium]
MIPVEDALGRILAGLAKHAPLAAEDILLSEALGRVLAEDVCARVTQPPAALSAMDGWAVRAADVATVPATLTRIGSVPAGASFDGTVGPGETVRIFTGAPLPAGADTIVIQEDADQDGDRVRVREGAPKGTFVRPAGLDFTKGAVGLTAGRRLTARDVGLAAAMNHPWLRVRRRPRVAILATGDEIVRPGDPIGPNQIVSSNALALSGLVKSVGGDPIMLGIAPDETDALRRMAAGAAGMDFFVTTGGASVGDHDLVRSGLTPDGLALDFWTIAMRPGKPLMFGTLNGVPMLGLPGNPVSSMVCAIIFLKPALETLLGLAASNEPRQTALLATDLKAN